MGSPFTQAAAGMTETAAPIYYFQEEQHFNRLVLVIALLPLVIAGLHVLVVGLSTGSPYLAVFTSIGIALVLYMSKLVTKVDSKHLHLSFPPFNFFMSRRLQYISLSDITYWQARTYSPILEYGGWGLRRGASGRAYNMRGNQGVQLQLTDGTKLLIGSQRAQELANAITLAKSHNSI